MIRRAYPGDGRAAIESVENGETRERGTGAADPSATRHLHPFAVLRTEKRVVEGVTRVPGGDGKAEVKPPHDPMWP